MATTYPTRSLVKLMIVDDHFVVRSGLSASLELEEEITIISEYDRGEEALEAFLEQSPDVVLLDLQLPTLDGVATTKELCERFPRARVLIFSTFARDDEIQAALDAGAKGFIQKSASRSELLKAIHMVAGGGRYLPEDVSVRLRELRTGPSITPREREILALISNGRSNKEIGGELGISEDTVKRHVSHILNKLDVHDRAQATAEAIRRGILKLEKW